jgi:hypothetical protein
VDINAALRARNDLLDVAAAWPALLARLVPSKGAGGRAAPPSSRPPIDLAVSDLIADATGCACYWARVLLDETDWQPSGSTTPELLAAAAARHGHWTAADEATALAFADEAARLRAAVLRVVAPGGPPRWIGPCPEAGCAGELHMREGRTSSRCPACGHEVDEQAWRVALRAAFADRLMTRRELVSALLVLGEQVKSGTVDKWVQRRRLVPVIADPELFRFADVVELAAPHVAAWNG